MSSLAAELTAHLLLARFADPAEMIFLCKLLFLHQSRKHIYIYDLFWYHSALFMAPNTSNSHK